MALDIGKKLREALRKFTGKAVIDEEAVNTLLKEIQRALIAGDVDIQVVKELKDRIKERVFSEEREKALSLREFVLKVVYEELKKVVGETYSPRLDKHKIMLIGLYGSGKTTTAGKLAKFYKKRGLSVGLVAADFDRPAATEQLKQLASEVGAEFYIGQGKDTIERVKDAIKKAKEDVLIIDTAGRNALDSELIEELKKIYNEIKPEEVFLVVPSDIGKVLKKQVEALKDSLPITALVLSKFDSPGKGGAALMSAHLLNVPIAFLGTGEKLDALEVFKPESYVKRLLGLPDIESLIEKLKEMKVERTTEDFDFQTFLEQLKAAKGMSLESITSMLGLSDIPKEALMQGEERIKKIEALINSMTPEERRNPELLKNPSRVRRIAKGSGVPESEAKKIISDFFKMRKIWKKMRSNRGLLQKLSKIMKGGARWN